MKTIAIITLLLFGSIGIIGIISERPILMTIGLGGSVFTMEVGKNNNHNS